VSGALSLHFSFASSTAVANFAAEDSQIANQKGGALRSYLIKLSYNNYSDDHKVDADGSLDVNWYFDCRDSRLSFCGINGRVRVRVREWVGV